MHTRLYSVAAALLLLGVTAIPVVTLLGGDSQAGPASAAPVALADKDNDVGKTFIDRAVFFNAMKERIAEMNRRFPGSGCGSDWECFKRCTLNVESNGNYGSVSSTGQYRGGYQYSQAFWDGQATEAGRPDLVGTDPAAASPEDQDYIAQHTWSVRGNDPWMGRC